jgi:hypothetical protein
MTESRGRRIRCRGGGVCGGTGLKGAFALLSSSKCPFRERLLDLTDGDDDGERAGDRAPRGRCFG